MSRFTLIASWFFTCLGMTFLLLVPLVAPESAFADEGDDCKSKCKDEMTCIGCCQASCKTQTCLDACCDKVCGNQTCLDNCKAQAKCAGDAVCSNGCFSTKCDDNACFMLGGCAPKCNKPGGSPCGPSCVCNFDTKGICHCVTP